MKTEKKETKKAAHSRRVAERKKAIADKKDAIRKQVEANPIFAAVQPLKVAAIKEAVDWAKEEIKEVKDDLVVHGGDINKAAPRLQFGKVLEREYEAANGKRNRYEDLTEDKDKKTYRGYYDEGPRFVRMSTKKMDRKIHIAERMASHQFEAYVFKLTVKIGPTISAELVVDPNEQGRSLWSHSILTVVTKAGLTQVWYTKMIVNRSVYGKIFFQWPTRLKKEK